MNRIDAVLGWLLIVFGSIHVVLTPKANPAIDVRALWFASGGLLMMAVGALNLLRVAYAGVAKGIRAVSVLANIVLLLLFIEIAVRVPLRSNPQVTTGIVLVVLLSACSILRRGQEPKLKTA